MDVAVTPRSQPAAGADRERFAARYGFPDGRLRRIAIAYGLGALALIGWAVYLGWSLPPRNVATHWDAAWVGFDALVVVALVATAILTARKDVRAVIPAVATATLLVADAWMDIATASRADLWQALASALVLELPIAAYSLWLAVRALGIVVHELRPRPPDDQVTS